MAKRQSNTESQGRKKAKKEPYGSHIVDEFKKGIKDNAVVGVIKSKLLCSAIMANDKKCELGRLRFSPDCFKLFNADAAGIMVIDCSLKKEAFEYYVCQGEEIVVDCKLSDMCTQIKGKNNAAVFAVIEIPKSKRESGMYGPLNIYFVNTIGLKERTRLRWDDLDLDMQQLQKNDLSYNFKIRMTSKNFSDIIKSLMKDKTADQLRIIASEKSLTIKNENGTTTCNQQTTINTVQSDLHYKFSPPNETKELQILVSRVRVSSMLDVPNSSDYKIVISGNLGIFNVQYILPEKCGIIQFYLATMLENDEYQ